MSLFNLGDWVIDTRTHRAVDIIAIVPAGINSIVDLYIVQDSENKYYIVDSNALIKYDKHYWDGLEVEYE